jgi:hypothetical protein
VSPLVWQQLRQCKCRKLGVTSSESDESHGHDERVRILCRPTDKEADEEEDIAAYDEPSTPEQITICCSLGKRLG